MGYFCPLGSRSRIRIRIRIHWPDWIRFQCGSGSATLHFSSWSDIYLLILYIKWLLYLELSQCLQIFSLKCKYTVPVLCQLIRISELYVPVRFIQKVIRIPVRNTYPVPRHTLRFCSFILSVRYYLDMNFLFPRAKVWGCGLEISIWGPKSWSG